MILLRATLCLLAWGCVLSAPGNGFDAANPFARSKPGDWLKYRVSMGDRSSLLRQAVTAKSGDSITFDVESEMNAGGQTLRSVIEMVEKLGSREVVSMRMKTGDGQVMDLSNMVAEVSLSMRAKDPFAPGAAPWAPVGTEKVTVPAGTFECARYRRPRGASDAEPQLDVWICPDAPHTGVVRMESSAGFKMELLASGRDATPVLP